MYTVRKAIIEAIDEEMERDENVFVIGEEVGRSGGPYGTTQALLEKYGEMRVVDTPISEIGFTGLAVGASYMGLRPIVDFMSWAFSLQSIDHIINSCAKVPFMSNGRIRCPIVFRGPSGYNPGYAAEHTQEFFNIYGSIPEIVVVAPYTPQEHKEVFKMAIRSDEPVLILENECLYDKEGMRDERNEDVSVNREGEYEKMNKEGECEKMDANGSNGYEVSGNSRVGSNDWCRDTVGDIKFGKSRILRPGTGITIVGVSKCLEMIEGAIEKTECSVELINLLFIRPLDIEGIAESVRKTGRLIIVDFGYPTFGLASEISAQIYSRLFGELKQRIGCLTCKDSFASYSKGEETSYYPTETDLLEMIESEIGNCENE